MWKKIEMLELWALGATKNSQKINEILNHIIRIIVSLYSMWVNPSLVVCVQDAILKVTVTVNMPRVARSLETNISWWTEDEWRKEKRTLENAEDSLKRHPVKIKQTYCFICWVCQAQKEKVEVTEEHLFELSWVWNGRGLAWCSKLELLYLF